MQRILVIRGGAIGDFVLTLPAIKLLRDAFPQSHLEILGYKHIIALAENRFYADATRSIEYAPLARFFAKGSDLAPELIAYFGSFDLIVSYLFDPDAIFENNVRRCGVEIFVACSPLVDASDHAAAQLASPLGQLGLALRSTAAQLYPSAEDREAAKSFLGETGLPLIALHPGSGSARKNWPVANWQQLSAQLLESRVGASLLFIGGEADEQALSAMRGQFRDTARFADFLPLPLLSAVLERCDHFVGHDSGISHIAAAVGTPCMLLFGATNPNVWAPANRNVQVLKASTGELAGVSPAWVYEAIRASSSLSTKPTS